MAEQAGAIKASLPSRGAWIETVGSRRGNAAHPRRSLHGERGLKLACASKLEGPDSRSLHGERGLKLDIRLL